MIYKCRECNKKGIDSVLVKDTPINLFCKICKRDVPLPEREPNSVPGASSNQIAPNHGLIRKELKAGNAYQPDMPEFGE